MERIRGPFQGVWNIIRFNWHFYLLSAALVVMALVLNVFLDARYLIFGYSAVFLIVAGTAISLLVSYYVYDVSNLYELDWLPETTRPTGTRIVNINAGFDETSVLLESKFPDSELIVFDFYDPSAHTEVSIQRARKAYPPFPNTRQVSTSSLPLPDNYADRIFVILSAHEIRDTDERTVFFAELKRVLNRTGHIVVTEHLRDVPNFLAYNLGAFHFLSKSSWYETFRNVGLSISAEVGITPFITTFILEKHGAAS